MTIAAASTTPTVGPPARSGGGRLAWTAAGLVLAVAFVGFGVVNWVGDIAYQAIPASQRVITVPVRAVSVAVDEGSVTIERGSGPNTIVETSGARGIVWPSDHEQISDGTLVIHSSCGSTFLNNRCHRDYVLRVPPQVSVMARSAQGDLAVVGVEGALDLHSDEGQVSVTGAAGSVQASSDQGGVSATQLTSRSVTANAAQGTVELGFVSPPSRVTASSDQGGVSVLLPHGNLSYQVHARSDQGSVTVGVADDPASPRVVNASSSQGDVSVRYGTS
jgi:hypothetical protein